MTDVSFASDYGTLPRALLSLGGLTNPTELIRGEELYRMLALCGVRACENGAHASDWELFSAFCRVSDSLAGHPAAECMRALLRDVCGITAPFSDAFAPQLWREAIVALEKKKLTLASILPGGVPCLTEVGGELSVLPEGGRPMLDGVSLLPFSHASLDGWSAQIADETERFFDVGCERILFRLPRGFVFVPPNPHSVTVALKNTRRTGEESFLLLSQLFRELCVCARRGGASILVEAVRDSDALPLLSYAERTVGLPQVCLAISEPCLNEETAELAAALSPRLTLALSLRAFPTEHELEQALLSAAARYPVGRLSFICAADLRTAAVAQANARRVICRIMEKSFEKK